MESKQSVGGAGAGDPGREIGIPPDMIDVERDAERRRRLRGRIGG